MARMRRAESRAIRAWSFNQRRRRLTVRLRDGATWRYWLAATPPDHDGSACAICQRGAAAIAAEFEAAESKGRFYNAVLRRGGHFASERAPDWRRRGAARRIPLVLVESSRVPDREHDTSPLRPATPATAPRWSRPAGRHCSAWRSALTAASVWGATALLALGAFSALAGPVRAATPSSPPFNPCSPFGSQGLAPVTSGVDQSGHATSSAAATTVLCVEAFVQVTGPAENDAPIPATSLLSQVSADFTVHVGRTSDPAIRSLLGPDFAAGSGRIVIVSDL